MVGFLRLRLAASLTLLLIASAALAEDAAGQRPRALKRQLQQPDEQREATKHAQQQIGELREADPVAVFVVGCARPNPGRPVHDSTIAPDPPEARRA